MKGEFKFYNFLSVLAITLLGIIIYSNSFDCTFHFDDIMDIVNNPKLHDFSKVSDWWNYVPSRALGFGTLALNYHFSNTNVWSYHFVNLAIHIINGLIIWWLMLMTFNTPNLKNNPIVKHKKTLSLLIALMFISHPMLTQAVTYIVQRLASQATLFYLLAMALYVKARLSLITNNELRITNNKPRTSVSQKSNKVIAKDPVKIPKTATAASTRILSFEKIVSFKKAVPYIFFTLSFLSAIIGMLTKEITFTLPFAVILYEYCFFITKKFKINFKDYRIIIGAVIFLALLVIVPFEFKFNVFTPIAPQQSHKYTLTPFNYLFTQFRVLVTYIRLMFLPYNQNLDYDYPISETLFNLKTLLSLSLLLSILTVGVLLFKKYRLISFGIFYFFLASSVESSIIPIPNVIFEHRTYLPSFGFFLAVCVLIYYIFQKLKLGTSIGFFIISGMIIIYSYLTFERNKVWKDETSLWTDVAEKSPEKARPWTNLGEAKYLAGDSKGALEDFTKSIDLNPNFYLPFYNRGNLRSESKDYKGAIADFTKSISIIPYDHMAYNNRGAAKLNLEDYAGALKDFKKAIELKPKQAGYYYNCADAFNRAGMNDSAIIYYQKAIDVQPNYGMAYYNRAVVYEKMNNIDKALEGYNEAIKVQPEIFEAYNNRGLLLQGKGKVKEAIEDFTKALSINPNLVQAYYNRGRAYDAFRDAKNAIDNYNKVIELSPDFVTAYFARANAEMALKQVKNAIDDYTKAIELKPDYSFAYKNRGVAKFQFNDKKGACMDWRMALQLGIDDVSQYILTYCN